MLVLVRGDAAEDLASLFSGERVMHAVPSRYSLDLVGDVTRHQLPIHRTLENHQEQQPGSGVAPSVHDCCHC